MPKVSTAAHGSGMYLIGRWMVRSGDIHFADEKTAFILAMAHESPQIKFPHGIPERGDAVRLNIGWDMCYQRGAEKHRALAKMVLRVVPLREGLRQDAEIHFVQVPHLRLDADEYRPLRPVSLHATNSAEIRTWYAVKLTRDTAPLLAQALRENVFGAPEMPRPEPRWLREPEYSTLDGAPLSGDEARLILDACEPELDVTSPHPC